MKFKKFIGTLSTVVITVLVAVAFIKRILIHEDDLKNVVRKKHNVLEDAGISSAENQNKSMRYIDDRPKAVRCVGFHCMEAEA